MKHRELTEELRALTETICLELVSNRPKLRVRMEEDEGIFALIIQPADEDIGRLIGKNGDRYRAFQALARAVAIKTNLAITVPRLSEPRDGKPSSRLEEPVGDHITKLREIADRLAQLCCMWPEDADVEISDKFGMVNLHIHVSPNEDDGAVITYNRTFHNLLDAVGFRRGVQVRAVVTADATEQPSSAAGKHAAAVPR